MCLQTARSRRKSNLKFFELLFHRGESDRDRELFAVSNLLDFQLCKSLDELGAQVIGISGNANLSDCEAQKDFLVATLNVEQMDVGKDAVFGFTRPGYVEC